MNAFSKPTQTHHRKIICAALIGHISTVGLSSAAIIAENTPAGLKLTITTPIQFTASSAGSVPTVLRIGLVNIYNTSISQGSSTTSGTTALTWGANIVLSGQSVFNSGKDLVFNYGFGPFSWGADQVFTLTAGERLFFTNPSPALPDTPPGSIVISLSAGGATLPFATTTVSFSVIPEPSSTTIFLLGAAMMVCRRSDRRSIQLTNS